MAGDGTYRFSIRLGNWSAETRKGTTGTGRMGEQLEEPETVVPSKGLEPPHPCEYMDLNHARLPIPPRWQKVTGMRPSFQAALQERTTSNILQGERRLSNPALPWKMSPSRLT
jgi:hypothetical protein